MDKLARVSQRFRRRFRSQRMPQRALESTLESTAAYALWAASYPPHAHNQIMALEQAAMLRLMPTLAGRAVLDLACGTGRYSLISREVDPALVIGTCNSSPILPPGPA